MSFYVVDTWADYIVAHCNSKEEVLSKARELNESYGEPRYCVVKGV